MTEVSGKVVFTGSLDVAECLQEMIESGEFEAILGITIQSVNVKEVYTESLKLNQWLLGIFHSGWQALEEILLPKQIIAMPGVWDSEKINHSKSVSRGKVYSLGNSSFCLAIKITEDEKEDKKQESVTLLLELYPLSAETLPQNLRMSVCDDEEEVFTKMSETNQERMQAEFDADQGDRFSVELRLEDESVIERFEV